MKTKRKSVTRRTMHYYLKIYARYKFTAIVGIVCIIAGVALGTIAFRYYLAVLFEQLSRLSDIGTGAVWGTFWLLIILMAIEVTFWRINDYTFVRRQSRSLRDLERFVFNKLNAHSYRFFSDNFAGSLTTQFNRFVRSYEQIEDIFMFEILTTLFTLIFAIGVMLFIAPPLGIAMLIWSILFIGVISWLTIKKSPITRASSAADSRVTANIADAITNVLNVKTFARSKYESQRFKNTSEDRFLKRQRSWMYDAHIRNVRWIFVSVFLIIYLYISIRLVSNGSVTLATVLAAQLYIMTIYNQLFNLNRTIQHVELAFSDAAEMTEILDKTPEVLDPINPEKSAIKAGAINFRNMTFQYNDAADSVLENFNLEIKKGQKIGLVGHSGSGKSTLSRLLLRFMDIQKGSIEIDGQNIAHIRQEDLREQIAYVPQESILFHRSLIENIRYGKINASDEEVYEAARLAHAADFIDKLPDGYKTMVGERGVKLSGGQRQRIAIARAMLKESPILVLDEATSALDSESEKLIQDALWKLMEGKTAVVIAHRLSTVQKMDKIIVLDNGKIVEQGAHTELLAKNGVYASLWNHQSGGFLED